jgi:penicillin G amidase
VQVDYGIKLVEAETYMGAIFGLGFVQAKDRLWQLNFYRYVARGRLSELIGSTGLPIDKFIRTIGIPRAARRFKEVLDPIERNFIQNFCNGINKAAQHVKLYPVEF